MHRCPDGILVRRAVQLFGWPINSITFNEPMSGSILCRYRDSCASVPMIGRGCGDHRCQRDHRFGWPCRRLDDLDYHRPLSSRIRLNNEVGPAIRRDPVIQGAPIAAAIAALLPAASHAKCRRVLITRPVAQPARKRPPSITSHCCPGKQISESRRREE